MSATEPTYDVSSLVILDGLTAVRKRPGMYIGSTDSRGLVHCLWEIIDNAVDEALAGFCTHIDVLLNPDGSVEVRDDGRGIPVDVDPKSGLSGAAIVFTKLHAGGKFGGGGYAVSGGLHGVGASVVNALSARLDVEIDRGGKTYAMSFRQGTAGSFAKPGPQATFTAGGDLRPVRGARPAGTGTRVRYWSDPSVFLPDASLDLDLIHTRARQTAFLVPGLHLSVTDARGGSEAATTVEFHYSGGIQDFVEHLSAGNHVSPVLRISGEGRFSESVPVLGEDEVMTMADVERTVVVDVALRWVNGWENNIRSFVNIVSTPKGGTHVTGFERALVRAINERLRETKMLKVAEESVTKEDCSEGLIAVVTVKLAEPQFEGQTKEILGTAAVTRIVNDVVGEGLRAFLSDTRGNKLAAKAVCDKVVAAARTRQAARAERDALRKKSKVESNTMPAKLADCRSDDVALNEILIVEGDSAMGTAKNARDSEFQALLPIRGKILNVHKASMADMLRNAECAAIITAVGAGCGKTFDAEQARYGKIIIMADADVDGGHIRCLLLTLFFRYMRPLLESGRIYSAVPPLYKIEVSKREQYYAYSDAERDEIIAKLGREGKKVDPNKLQRYKGLGEMDAEQLAETTLDPDRRQLRQVTVADAEEMSRMFDLLMGADVAPRRDFIISSSGLIDPLRIDA